MTEHYRSFEEWYVELLKVAKERHWNIENPDEWRNYYNCSFTPEQAFESETGAPDDTDNPAGY